MGSAGFIQFFERGKAAIFFVFTNLPNHLFLNVQVGPDLYLSN